MSTETITITEHMLDHLAHDIDAAGPGQSTWLKFPDAHFEFTLEHDENEESPVIQAGVPHEWRTANEELTVYSFNRKHVNFDPEAIHLLDKYPDRAFQLSCYEHGSSHWWPTGYDTGMQCQWDTAALAGVALVGTNLATHARIAPTFAKTYPGDTVRDRLGAYVAEQMRLYTQWCNGGVRRLVASRYPVVKHDGEMKRLADPVESGHVGGLYYNELGSYLENEVLGSVGVRVSRGIRA